MPLTPRKQRGFFDIVMKRDKGELDDGLKSTRSAREFSHFLDNLPLGKLLAWLRSRQAAAAAFLCLVRASCFPRPRALLGVLGWRQGRPCRRG